MFQSMEFLTTTSLLTLVLLLVVVLKIWECCWILVLRPLLLSRRFRKQGIFGPKYRLLYGNIQDIKKMKIEANLSVLDPNTNEIFHRVYPHFHQWMSQYGETFLYWNGTEPTLCISDPELAKQILLSKLGFSAIPKRRHEVLIYFGKGLPFTEGVDWVRHRRILNPAFSTDRIKVMAKSMVDCTLRMFEEWGKKSKDEETEQNVMKMEMCKEFDRLASDVIATTAFGSSYVQGIEIFRAQIELQKACVTSAIKVFIPGTQYLPTPSNLQIWKLDRKVKNMIKRIIDTRLKSSNYGDDLLGIMLNSATSEDSEKKMSIDEIIEECKTFFISGHGTTSILLTWTTMLLSLHQDWQEKLREEVFKECSKDKIPDSDTFSKLKLMNMVLLESLRLYGPVIKLFREATQDIKVGDVEIPKGTNIFLSLLKIHSNKTVWGENADKFNPLRFANGVSQAGNHPNALLAFSIGPRACIGQNFSIIEAKTVFIMILQRFKLSLSDDYKHAPLDHLSLKPQFGLPIIFQPI